MTKRRVGPKTDPQRSELYYKTADRRRALKALDQMTKWQHEAWRWRQVAAWTPESHAQTRSRAVHHAEVAERRFQGYREVVWQALGYDPSEDGPPPKTHWDKGAMED